MEKVAKLKLPGGEISQVAILSPVLRQTRFRSYNKWLKEKFGERVYKVIVDAGFTLPG